MYGMYVPLTGGPTMEDVPRNRVNSPNAENKSKLLVGPVLRSQTSRFRVLLPQLKPLVSAIKTPKKILRVSCFVNSFCYYNNSKFIVTFDIVEPENGALEPIFCL